MTWEEYRDIDALNWSSLKAMYVSPRYYQWLQDHPKPSTQALALGTAVHHAILEPEKYVKQCVTRPDEWDSWRTKASREWREEEEQAGRTVIDDETAATVQATVQAVHDHPAAMELLDGTLREEVVTWTVDGVKCKGRLDAIASNRIVDLKTARSIDRREFGSAFARLLYHGQLPWYLDGAISAGLCSPDAQAYVIAVETGEDHDVGAFRIGQPTMDSGRALYRRLLDTWVSCRREDVWPGRYPALEVFDAPPWAAGMTDEEEEGF